MPSRKGLEQALIWLKSKMAEKDTFDAINAETTYNVIMDMQRQRKKIGALYYRASNSNRRAQEKLQEMSTDRYEDTLSDLELEMLQKEMEMIFLGGEGQ